MLITVLGTNDKPTLKQLNRHVRPDAATHWKDLGIELLSAEKISVIKCNDPGDVNACCTEMFNAWLRQDTQASWIKIVNALRAPSVELFVLAAKIEREFISGRSCACGLSIVHCIYHSFNFRGH